MHVSLLKLGKMFFYLNSKAVSVLEIFKFSNFTIIHFMMPSSAWQVDAVGQWNLASLSNTGVFLEIYFGRR